MVAVLRGDEGLAASRAVAVEPRDEPGPYHIRRAVELYRLDARQFVVLFVRAGWRVSELAAALRVPRCLLDVVVLTGGAPVGLADELAGLVDREVPNCEWTGPCTARQHLASHPHSTWDGAVLALPPETLGAVWSKPGRPRDGQFRYQPPTTWTRLSGRVAAVRLHEPRNAAALMRTRFQRTSAQDLGEQQYVAWPATAAGLAALPRVQGNPSLIGLAEGQHGAA